jgi:hypothetical protein
MAAGKASFHLPSADALPFTNDSFDRVFLIDVFHFSTEPPASLSECARASSGRRDGHGMPCQRMRRTLRRRSLASIRVAPLSGNTLCHGFADADVQTVVSDQTVPSGAPGKRYSIAMRARAGGPQLARRSGRPDLSEIALNRRD